MNTWTETDRSIGMSAAISLVVIVVVYVCVLAALAPATGEMQIQWLGIVGYAFVLPVTSVLLALLFAQTHQEVR